MLQHAMGENAYTSSAGFAQRYRSRKRGQHPVVDLFLHMLVCGFRTLQIRQGHPAIRDQASHTRSVFTLTPFFSCCMAAKCLAPAVQFALRNRPVWQSSRTYARSAPAGALTIRKNEIMHPLANTTFPSIRFSGIGRKGSLAVFSLPSP